MRVLITGSGGFAGAHLARSLEEDGHHVTGFWRWSGADVRDYEQVLSAVREAEPDQVFHLAAVSSPAEALADPRRAFDVNAGGTLNVLEAVRRAGCGARVLIAGSSDEYGPGVPGMITDEESPCRPEGPYGASKLAATAMGVAWAQSFGIPVTVTRAFMHAGPGRRAPGMLSSLARQVAAAERGETDHVTCPDAASTVDLTDVRDVVRAYRLAIGLEPGIWNVCRGELTSLGEIFSVLETLSVLPRLPLVHGLAPVRHMPLASAAKLASAAGWKPEIPLRDTLCGLLGYWRSR